MRSSYRWTDHVIAPTRSRADLMATILFLAIVGFANLVPSRHTISPSNRAEVALSAGHAHALPGRASHTCERYQSRISSPST